MNIEIEKLQKLTSDIPFPFTIILDTNKTAKHWFLSYNYFVIREDYTFENLPFKTVYDSPHRDKSIIFKGFAEKEVLDSIKQYWKTDFEIGRIEIIAWCSEIVEKDSSLFFLYDNQDNYKGLYCHCSSYVTWAEDIVYVGNGLSDFFDLNMTFNEFEKCDSNYVLPRKKLSKAKKQTFEELLTKDEYLILDAEVGCEPNFDLYKNFIDTMMIPMTKNKLKYTNLKFVSDSNGILEFIWEYDTSEVKFTLRNELDYIDTDGFYKKLNEVLLHCASTKLFIPFRHYDFGQEYGLAYLDSKKAKKLSELFNIELI